MITSRCRISKMSAKKIVELLAIKHGSDLFVPECKDGPSYGHNADGGSHFRLDAWAMKRSWANPCAYGYEIKVSRQDFLSDEKWRTYMELCNQFYFVCTPNIILPEELPPEAGLLWTSKNLKRLYTKKKAPWRDVEIPDSLYRYILMCRVKITGERDNEKDNIKSWQAWLREKDDKKKLGWNVSKKIRELVKERITKAEQKNKDLESKQAVYKQVAEILDDLGITAHSWDIQRERVERKRKAFESGIRKELIRPMRDAHRALDVFLQSLKDYE